MKAADSKKAGMTQEQTVAFQSTRDPEITCITEIYESEGTALAVDVYGPNREKYPGLRPGILFFFGGGFRVGIRHAFREQAQACARHGYVALSADYRIRSVHGTTPRESMVDGAAAWLWLRANAARWRLDPNRVVLSGGSAGGLIAAMCGPITGIYPAGLALFNPAIPDGGRADDPIAQLTGRMVDDVPVLTSTGIRPGMPPMLLLHGEDDQIIPAYVMRALAQNANAQGVKTKLVLYPGMAHGFFNYNRDRAHFYLTLGELLMFLDALNA